MKAAEAWRSISKWAGSACELRVCRVRYRNIRAGKVHLLSREMCLPHKPGNRSWIPRIHLRMGEKFALAVSGTAGCWRALKENGGSHLSPPTPGTCSISATFLGQPGVSGWENLSFPPIANPATSFAQGSPRFHLRFCGCFGLVLVFRDGASYRVGWSEALLVAENELDLLILFTSGGLGSQVCSSRPVLCSAWDRTQSFVNARQALCQLSYVLSP